MAKFLDITNWNEKPYFNTKGTRNKCVVSDPKDESLYFFKTSLLKDKKDYKTEFWSEIISSEIGRYLGFNVLEYNIAKHRDELGCISKSMNTENECLTEGISLLTGYDNTYNPDDKESYSNYTFDFILSALDCFNLGDQKDEIIKTIIFDSIIGNCDRHQENWGFITQSYTEKTLTKEEAKKHFRILRNAFKQIKEYIANDDSIEKNKKIILEKELNKIFYIDGKYSPIYDSGSCLGREKDEDSVIEMLKNDVMLNSFINRGKYEIRWNNDGTKLNHFELIQNIYTKYPDIVLSIINKVISLYDKNKIREIVFNIDKELPQDLKERHLLSGPRKELIYKMINERYERLKKIIL